jgi:hypothetical protein
MRDTILGEAGTPVRHRRRRQRQRPLDSGIAIPSDAINSAFARTTSRCAPDCDRANDSSNSRCPAELQRRHRLPHPAILSNPLLFIYESHH